MMMFFKQKEQDWVEFMSFPSSWMNLMKKFSNEEGDMHLKFHNKQQI
jgi:hypothetical protein